jgi:hypothetical protein
LRGGIWGSLELLLLNFFEWIFELMEFFKWENLVFLLENFGRERFYFSNNNIFSCEKSYSFELEKIGSKNPYFLESQKFLAAESFFSNGKFSWTTKIRILKVQNAIFQG